MKEIQQGKEADFGIAKLTDYDLFSVLFNTLYYELKLSFEETIL